MCFIKTIGKLCERKRKSVSKHYLLGWSTTCEASQIKAFRSHSHKQTIECDISISNKCFSFGYLYRFKVTLAIKLTFPCTHFTFDLSATVFRAVHHSENTLIYGMFCFRVYLTRRIEEVKQHMRQISDTLYIYVSVSLFVIPDLILYINNNKQKMAHKRKKRAHTLNGYG